MKRTVFALAFGAVLANGVPAQAGVIERACNASDRRAASAVLCACIQSVADQVLSPSDQRKGAAFFSDPHRSQETRQSDNSSDEVFWLRWKDFGAAATQFCR